MSLSKSERINALAELGEMLNPQNPLMAEIAERAHLKNAWFTNENVSFCLENWHQNLTQSKLTTWLNEVPENPIVQKKVGLVMAGNIPLVGLHDLISILGVGHQAVIKCSHKDDVLMPFVIETLKEINPKLTELLILSDDLRQVDAIIATGSDNTTRYFEYYFGKIPHIFRGNRTGVAVLNGAESADELALLADDVFTYFGMGCRSVTKLFVPMDYNMIPLIDAFHKYEEVKNHFKYSNNYTYHKAIFLMNLDPHLDSGFMLFKEDTQLHAPLGCIFYERYESMDKIKIRLRDQKDQIQLIVSNIPEVADCRFGKAQNTGLSDYADNIDTLAFLTNL